MRALRLIWRSLGGLWAVVMMLLMAGSLALNVAMAVVPAVALAVGSAVEAVTGIRSLASRNTARVARLEAVAAREAATARAAVARAERAAAEARAARQVVYRGARRTAAEAVADTSDRLARRTARAAGRTVGSSFGEAIPVVGVGVIAAAIAWELKDSCDMMAEIRELDVALNPDRAVPADATAVCGMKAPTRDEIWSAVASSPGKAWAEARDLYSELPDISLDGTWQGAAGMFRASYDWAFGTPAGPVAPPDGAGLPPRAGMPDAAERGGDPGWSFNPLNWWDGE